MVCACACVLWKRKEIQFSGSWCIGARAPRVFSCCGIFHIFLSLFPSAILALAIRIVSFDIDTSSESVYSMKCCKFVCNILWTIHTRSLIQIQFQRYALHKKESEKNPAEYIWKYRSTESEAKIVDPTLSLLANVYAEKRWTAEKSDRFDTHFTWVNYLGDLCVWFVSVCNLYKKKVAHTAPLIVPNVCTPHRENQRQFLNKSMQMTTHFTDDCSIWWSENESLALLRNVHMPNRPEHIVRLCCIIKLRQIHLMTMIKWLK